MQISLLSLSHLRLPLRIWLATLILCMIYVGSCMNPVLAEVFPAPILDHVPPTLLPDDGGEDDYGSTNNQSDLSAIVVGHNQYGWAWDESFLSGGNTQDVCVYWSIDGADGTAERALCYQVISDGDDGSGGFIVDSESVVVYDCPSGTYSTGAPPGGQKCTGNPPVSTDTSAVCTLTSNVQPYFTTDPDLDTQVLCDVTSTQTLTLVNICSKTGNSPSSSSKDCGLADPPAFLKLSKVVSDGTAIPSDFTLAYTNNGSSSGSVSGDNTQFIPLPPGTYNLTESGPSGYTLDSLICDNNDSGGTATLASNDIVACTFTNKLATAPSYRIAKTAVISDSAPAVDQAGDVILYTITLINDGSQALTNVSVNDPLLSTLNGPSGDNAPAGQLDVGETWTYTGTYAVTQDDLDTNGGGDGDIDNTVSATTSEISDPKTASAEVPINLIAEVRIIKETIGGDGPFSFDVENTSGLTAVSVDTTSVTSQTITSIPGVHTITETIPVGWKLNSISCSGLFTRNGAAVSFDAAAGTRVTCTFVNEKLSKLTIIKKTIGGDDQFGFTTDISGHANKSVTTSSGTGQTTITDLPSGTYAISESSDPGWDLTESRCSNGDTPNNLQLQSGVDVSCTFTNTKRSNLTIIKQTEGIDGDFVFSASFLTEPFTITTQSNEGSQTFNNLLPRAYDVDEIVPSGWELTNGSCSNTGTPEINLSPGSDISCTYINDPLPVATVSKEAATTRLPEPGGSVLFTVTVQNLTPGEALTLTTITDAPFGIVADESDPTSDSIVSTDCQVPQVLAAADANGQNGGSYNCTFSVMVNGEPDDYDDVVTVTLYDDELNQTSPTDDATVTITNVEPQARVLKVAESDTLFEPGGPVTFAITVTNLSSAEVVTITNLVDDPFGNILAVTDPVLATTCTVPIQLSMQGQDGDSYSCTFTVDMSDSQPGAYSDTVTATVVDNEGGQANPEDSATVTIAEVLPDFSVTKTATPVSLPEPGGPVTFTILVQNNSTVDSITLNELDDSVYGLLCDSVLPVELDPGENYECEVVENVLGNPGFIHANTVTARGVDDDDQDVSDSDSAEVSISDLPSSISVIKQADVSEVPESGGTVNFSVRVANTSSVDSVTITTLNDSVFGDLSMLCTNVTLPTVLPPTAEILCEFSQFLNGPSGSQHDNLVTAVGTDDDGLEVSGSDDETVRYDNVLSAIKVVKTAAPTELSEPGGDATFTVSVTNTSPSDAVTIEQIIDEIDGNMLDLTTQCGFDAGIQLAPGEGATCTFTLPVTGQAGEIQVDTITVSGVDDDGQQVSDSDSAQVRIINVASAIAVEKTASRSAIPEPGGNVTFTILAQNVSAIDSVTITEVSDSEFGDISGQCQPSLPTLLLPGETVTCIVVESITGNAGMEHRNVVTVSGVDDDDEPLQATDDARVLISDLPSGIMVTKRADQTEIREPGGDVTFTVEVKNSSVVDNVTIESFADDIFGPLTALCPDQIILPLVLAPAESATCVFIEPVLGNADDIHRNVVTAIGTDDDGANVSHSDDATVTITNLLPDVTLTKSANPAQVPETGGQVEFSVVVVNNSSFEAATITSLVDNRFGDLNGRGTCQIPQTLDARGGQYSCTFIESITGNVGDPHRNIITVEVQDDDGTTSVRNDDATVTFDDVLPEIGITKNANRTNVLETGEDVTFTFTIVNRSTESLTLISLIDDVFGDLNGAGDCVVPQKLAPSSVGQEDSYSCTVTEEITGTAGQAHQNTVAAIVQDDDGNEAQERASATVELLPAEPNLVLSKQDSIVNDIPDGPPTQGQASIGDTLRYTIRLLNNGNGTAFNVRFRDEPDANTALLVGSVTTTKGEINNGNGTGDTSVLIEIGDLAPNGQEIVTIVFDVLIEGDSESTILRNQASVLGEIDRVLGTTIEPVLSDDPDVSGVVDPTLTVIVLAPTSLDEIDEPMAPIIKALRIFVPFFAP